MKVQSDRSEFYNICCLTTETLFVVEIRPTFFGTLLLLVSLTPNIFGGLYLKHIWTLRGVSALGLFSLPRSTNRIYFFTYLLTYFLTGRNEVNQSTNKSKINE